MNILKRRASLIATISFLALAQSCETVEEAGTPVESVSRDAETVDRTSGPGVDNADNTPTVMSSDRQTMDRLNTGPEPPEHKTPGQVNRSETDNAEGTPTVTLVDQKIIDRLNTGPEPPERETSGREDASVKDSALLATPTNTTVAPAEAEFDIASLYTRVTVKGIPVIENPNCGIAPADIRITVFNPDRIRGHIVVDLYNHVKEDFLDPEKAILRIITRVTGEETTLCVPVDNTGDYAFALYHDRNSNEKLDKNFLGMPSERFALSNNPDYGMRTPDFEKVVFTVPPGGVEQRIRLMSSGDVISGKRG
ncbi:MAG: DUF2141 domain-containing protein [Hyphomonadaceae bacterium]|nr:DUF2141 domain-containing protein [Hyphomonadaceae bacterium]MBC6412311.1 DUF2141 domain-containing protein [Hyphomonadaceae bacterium]